MSQGNQQRIGRMSVKLFFNAFKAGIGVFLICGGIARADSVFVTDTANGTVEKFDSSGNPTIFASGLSSPTGLAFDSAGNLYVANAGNGTIQKFDSTGNGSVFASGLNNPAGLAFDRSGNLYVANLAASGSIEKFDSSGNGSVVFSGLSGPNYLTFDPNGNLCATTANTIERFDSSGNESTIWETLGGCGGLAFDAAGSLYAVTEDYPQVSVHSSSGDYVIRDYWLTVTGPYGQHHWATGLAIDSNDNLYVAGHNEVSIFDSARNGSVFASNLGDVNYIAIQIVPEPSTWTQIAMFFALLFVSRQYGRRFWKPLQSTDKGFFVGQP